MAGTMHELRGVVGPAGAYRGPRGQILVELKRTEPLSAKELAARLGLSLNAVRHHLKELEAEGVLDYVREHRSVGAPAFAYRLSAQGQALFPRRYQETLTYILEHVAVRDGRTAAIAMLEAHLQGMAARLKVELAGLTPEQRVEAVTRLRSEDGYMAEWQSAGPGAATIREHNCAIHAIAERFPEICAAEERFMAEVLGAPVERRQHILSGCTACEYHVQFDTPRAPADAATEVVQIRPRDARPGANPE
jgi:DeoR family suf operon transcriptional repressor